MSQRIQLTAIVIVALIVFPFLIVRAQSQESATSSPSGGEVSVEETAPEDPVVDEQAAPTEEATGEQSGGEEAALEQSITEDEVTATGEATETQMSATEMALASASSTDLVASSSPPVVEPKPYVLPEPTFVLQPAVDLTIRGDDLSARIGFENLTCKRCDKKLPKLDVEVYYTGWYGNDGEVGDIGPRYKEEKSDVDGVGLWDKKDMTWTAADVPAGRYYFVIVVDPQNKHDAYRMHRSEFRI